MDRKELCHKYLEQYPEDAYDILIHHIISDYNFEDHWVFGAIANIARILEDDDSDVEYRRQFDFLVKLLTLPLPEGWDDEDDE